MNRTPRRHSSSVLTKAAESYLKSERMASYYLPERPVACSTWPKTRRSKRLTSKARSKPCRSIYVLCPSRNSQEYDMNGWQYTLAITATSPLILHSGSNMWPYLGSSSKGESWQQCLYTFIIRHPASQSTSASFLQQSSLFIYYLQAPRRHTSST